MKVIECRGGHREMGRQAGEALREEIRFQVQRWAAPANPTIDARTATMIDAARRHVPHLLEEIDGMVEGAGVPAELLYAINFPRYGNELDACGGCTNVVFGADAGSRHGAIWGKNNDGEALGKRRPACVKLVRPENGIPVAIVTHCANVAVTDGMNAEGVAVGHSSVGSAFQQSDHHVNFRLLSYDALLKTRTTGEFAAHMAALPTHEKGYAGVCVDRHGTMCAWEAPCPMFQVRAPGSQRGVYCTNCYMIPALAEADRRTPEGKSDAHARARYLDGVLASEESLALPRMQALLRHHRDEANLGSDPGICRHGESCGHWTEYATIGLPAQGKLLYAPGNPCESEFHEVSP